MYGNPYMSSGAGFFLIPVSVGHIVGDQPAIAPPRYDEVANRQMNIPIPFMHSGYPIGWAPQVQPQVIQVQPPGENVGNDNNLQYGMNRQMDGPLIQFLDNDLGLDEVDDNEVDMPPMPPGIPLLQNIEAAQMGLSTQENLAIPHQVYPTLPNQVNRD
ncbi:hypothetical protein QAD02_011327 [Eretmocerus hayati]|uniref:Uncharacterized protein n=1 Tax=Eretmocerus hayati TaxID=131215 RepID=A0ACC2NXL4_9HYME|nr:hypothetical protein QAD02_011327 [Eretmocerus hayati]